MIELLLRPGLAVIRPDGELDVANSGDLGTIVSSLIASEQTVFVLDLAALTFLDVAGAAPLVELAAHVRATTDAQFFLTWPQPFVARVLDLLGLSDLVVHRERLRIVPDLAVDGRADPVVISVTSETEQDTNA